MKYCHYLLLILMLCACSRKKEAPRKDPYLEMQKNAANIWAQPSFFGDDIFTKCTGTDFKLEIYYTDTGLVYFSAGKDYFDKASLSKLLLHTDSIETASVGADGRLHLGELSYGDTSRIFWMTAVRNLKIDSTAPVTVKFRDATYKTNLGEMMKFIRTTNLYDAGIYVKLHDNRVIVNHGAIVAMPGDRTLTAFANELTRNCKTPEAKAAALLRFVTKEISYDQAEASRNVETVKRPDEVLFTGKSDCSGKTILMASLLEQLHIPYCLLYYEGHICVGIAGKFSPHKPLTVAIDGRTYFITETTNPSSVIGEDCWGEVMHPGNIEYYQVPAADKHVFDYHTHQKYDFVQEAVSPKS